MVRINGFPPIASSKARVLILGSMPSEVSLRQAQYYAHTRNQFWKIMGELFGAGAELPYSTRVKKLTAQSVAIWDVLRSCERRGSLDASIRSETEVANDFTEFFHRHPRIRAVFFNGTKAQQTFARHVRPKLGAQVDGICFERLPSTSPAHAGRSFSHKLREWGRVKDFL